jgi:hypothetical protein
MPHSSSVVSLIGHPPYHKALCQALRQTVESLAPDADLIQAVFLA